MSDSLLGVGIAMGVVVLFVVFALPHLASAPEGSVNETVEMNESSATVVGDYIQLTASDVNETSGEATITVRDTSSGDSDTNTLSEADTTDYELGNETVSVTLEDVLSGGNSIVRVSYPSTFGWHSGTTAIAENMHLIILLVGSLGIFGILMAVVT